MHIQANFHRKIIMTPTPRIDISLLDKRFWQGISCKLQLGYQGFLKECCGPLTYLVEIESGVLWRRHADHIKGLQESEMFGEERAVEYQLISVDAATESTNGSHCIEHASDTEAASPIGADRPTTDRPEGNQSPQMTYSEMLPPPESQRLPAEVIATRIAWKIRVECTYKCGILLLP